MKGPPTAFIVAGGVTFLAARFVWSARLGAALAWAAIIGALGFWLATLKPKPLVSPDLTPEV